METASPTPQQKEQQQQELRSQVLAEAQRLDFKYWWNKLEALQEAHFLQREFIFLEALSHLPGSYKLWYHYLTESMDYCGDKALVGIEYSRFNEAFERCLIFMHKMPRIWILFLQFLVAQKKYSSIRKIFDRSLKALPLTQHSKIWDSISEWVKSLTSSTLGSHYFLRFIQMNPEAREDYVDFLVSREDYARAFQQIIELVNDGSFVSSKGKSNYMYCVELCELISQHPDQCTLISGEKVIRHCLGKYTDEISNLWVFLAEYYINQGLFEKAREIFEEALEKISTAKDFGIVYSAYLKFEEDFLTIIIEEDGLEDGDNSGQMQEEGKGEGKLSVQEMEQELARQVDQLLGLGHSKSLKIEINNQESKEEIAITRIENLIDRRDILLNSCNLRADPSNIEEWLSRVELLKDNREAQKRAYQESLVKIDPMVAEGELSEIWISFARFYEDQGEIGSANHVFWTAVNFTFKNQVREGVSLWISWCEMLLRLGAYQDARTVIKYPLNLSPDSSFGNLYIYSWKLWALYSDIVKRFSSLVELRSVYERMIDLRVISPKCLLNYAHHLISEKHFEEAFKVYEKGLEIFRWPALTSVWVNYLKSFENRYQAKKLERLRDMYERVLLHCPDDKKVLFFSMYSQLEEKYGLLNHAIEVIDRMVDSVTDDYKATAFNLYIAKVGDYLGVIRTKPIYEKSMEHLKGNDFINFGVRFASLESRLGEVDRARQIYNYVGPFVDPENDPHHFWSTWVEFERLSGNMDTYKDLMRVKRTVQSRFAILPPTLEKIERMEREEKDNIENNVQDEEKLKAQGELIRQTRLLIEERDRADDSPEPMPQESRLDVDIQ